MNAGWLFVAALCFACGITLFRTAHVLETKQRRRGGRRHRSAGSDRVRTPALRPMEADTPAISRRYTKPATASFPPASRSRTRALTPVASLLARRVGTATGTTTCPGGLILHADGTVVGCTEDDERDGCRGSELRHAGDPVSCVVWSPAGCDYCGSR